jgi:hypothetical protein
MHAVEATNYSTACTVRYPTGSLLPPLPSPTRTVRPPPSQTWTDLGLKLSLAFTLLWKVMIIIDHHHHLLERTTSE